MNNLLSIFMLSFSLTSLASTNTTVFAVCDNDQDGAGTRRVVLLERGRSVDMYYYKKGPSYKKWYLSYQENDVLVSETEWGSSRSGYDKVTIYDSKFEIFKILIFKEDKSRAITSGRNLGDGRRSSMIGDKLVCQYNVDVEL